MQREMWLSALIDNLSQIGDEGRGTVEYIRARKTKIGFRRARSAVGAFWTPFGNIRLNTQHYSNKTAINDPYLLSLIVHEVRHLQQGWVTALSVYGELDAWQLGFRMYRQMTGKLPKQIVAGELMSLPLGWDRNVLQRARQLMRIYAGKGYRADLLPYIPCLLKSGTV